MTPYQPHNLLVTGGAGFIGSNFIRYLLNENKTLRIINLDKLTYAGSLSNLQHLPHPKQHHFIQGDITNSTLIQHILAEHHIDTIVHFAAESHVDRSITGPAAFIETNIIGTFTLLEAGRTYWKKTVGLDPNQCRFHHISTDEVFGSLTKHAAAFNESTPYQPRSPYSASKAGSDHLVDAYYHTYDVPITLSNCSNNYGPYQHQEKFIPTIIRSCLTDNPIPVYGEGKNYRDWLYVTDHCEGIWKILTRGKIGEHYNIGGNNEWENIQLVHMICDHLDHLKPKSQPYRTLIEFVKDRPGHDFRYAIDNKKIRRELDWIPQTPMEEGIAQTIDYYINDFVLP